MANTAGMNWIRQEKRLAIYLRDGLACAYCGEAVEDGAKLTLDHLIPRVQGGSNQVSNLVTACHRCNSARGDRAVEEFASQGSGYLNHGLTTREITDHLTACVARPLPLDEAKILTTRRGSAARALAEMRRL